MDPADVTWYLEGVAAGQKPRQGAGLQGPARATRTCPLGVSWLWKVKSHSICRRLWGLCQSRAEEGSVVQGFGIQQAQAQTLGDPHSAAERRACGGEDVTLSSVDLPSRPWVELRGAPSVLPWPGAQPGPGLS